MIIFLFRLILLMLLFLPALLIPATPAAAQLRGAPSWLSGEMGKQRVSLNYSVTGDPTARDVQGQPGRDFQTLENKVRITVPISQDDGHEWLLTGRLMAWNIRTQAVLPTTSEAFPGHLWDLGFGTAYRKRFDNGWIGGIAVDLGSAGDKPFFSKDETTLSVNLFTRIPHDGQNALMLFLNYNNNREFWAHVPIPGIGYVFQKDRRYRVAVGVPFLLAEFRPWRGLGLECAYFPVRTVHGGINYELVKDLKIYGNFDWGNDEFFRADRTDKDKRLFYYEKRLTTGVSYRFHRRFLLDLGGGYVFDRMYFEGKDYSDRDFNRLDIQDGPFGRVRINLDF